MTTKPLAVFSTRDLKLATILLTLGFEPENPAAPATRIRRDSGDETTVFHFLATSPTGQQANQVMEWFRDADIFLEKNPEHPVAYLIAALRNRDTLVSVVKATPRQLVFERNGKIVSISENATEADKKRFAKFL